MVKKTKLKREIPSKYNIDPYDFHQLEMYQHDEDLREDLFTACKVEGLNINESNFFLT